MIPPTGPFPRTQRIRRSREFQELSRRGRRRGTEAFVVLTAPTHRDGARSRLGVTVSRQVGNAVVRNAVKRRIREWFRRSGRQQIEGLDVVVIARRAAASLDGNETSSELDRILRFD